MMNRVKEESDNWCEKQQFPERFMSPGDLVKGWVETKMNFIDRIRELVFISLHKEVFLSGMLQGCPVLSPSGLYFRWTNRQLYRAVLYWEKSFKLLLRVD